MNWRCRHGCRRESVNAGDMGMAALKILLPEGSEFAGESDSCSSVSRWHTSDAAIGSFK
jgi:hypothetical protein